MAGEIAKLFATLGFRIDEKGLTTFQNQLKGLKGQIDSSGGVTGATKKASNAQDDWFKNIKSSYTTKVKPSLSQMKDDLKLISDAFANNKITQEDYDKYRLRIVEQIGAAEKKKEVAHQRAIKETQVEQERAAKEQERQQKQAVAEFNRRQKANERFYKAQQAAREKVKKQLTQIEKKYDKEAFQLKEIRNNVKMINDAYRRGDITLEHRRRQVQQLAAEYRRLQAVQAQSAAQPFAGGRDPRQRGTHGLISALHSDAAIASMFGGFAAFSSVQSFQQFKAMEQGLTMASGSMEQAGEDMEYLIGLSRRLGVFVGDLGSSFASFSAAARGTNLTSDQTRNIFEGVASQARVLNLSAADTQGIMRAVTQILNKQQVMAIILWSCKTPLIAGTS